MGLKSMVCIGLGEYRAAHSFVNRRSNIECCNDHWSNRYRAQCIAIDCTFGATVYDIAVIVTTMYDITVFVTIMIVATSKVGDCGGYMLPVETKTVVTAIYNILADKSDIMSVQYLT